MSNTEAVTVRIARPEDVPAVCAIINHYIAHSTSNFRTEPYRVDEWTALLETHSERYPWLVAESGGEVAGLAYAGPWNPRDAYAWTAEATVYVADGHRGKRIGSLLYDELFKRLEQQGFRSVMAQVTRPNPGSEALHAASGFERVGTIRDAGYKHGAWHDVGIWQRELGSLDDPPRPTLPVE
ncbi:GNAT family N-acetyltransferase [Glycomyces tenuis]|uniref:GNAT family N-acetyltransferase n=1 Tax=Glycomyces tenuis TaxID=58116 RepID=UPI0005508CCF|nr:GNAT family N-acetyltransferase [Glycomyces tenuis]